MRATFFGASEDARTVFAKVFALTLAAKLALAAWLPITGDEAFFYQWGVSPDWGYSDHPPMVGWLLWLLRHLGDSPFALRLATVLLTSVVALAVVDLVRRLLPPDREDSAWLAGAVYLALPFSWVAVLVTTDTPLIFFMTASWWCFVRAELPRPGPPAGDRDAALAIPRAAVGWYAASGALLGMAFLSKYFAVLVGLGYAVWLLGWRRKRAWVLVLIAVCALPGVAVNLAFNATHGWTNIMFNVFNRNQGAKWSVSHWVTYLGMMVYLLTPWLIWQALRAKPGTEAGSAADGQDLDSKASGHAASSDLTRRDLPPRHTGSLLVMVLWATPFLLFALVATRRTVGLHWVLGFVPLFVLWAGLRLSPQALRKALRWNGWLALPHVLLLAAVFAAPLAWWQRSSQFASVVFLREAPAVTTALRTGLPPDAALMARGYSPAAVLAFHSGRYVPVFGVGRHHARQDDLSVDFKEFDGRPVRIFDRKPLDEADFAPYFESVKAASFEVDGQRLHYLDGQGFRFETYRDQILREAADRFHRVPDWLPLLRSPFCERYGFADCSSSRTR
ncbi:MAG: glycosyltransferase family 39 protein [Rubrivivax sp.]|jgi:4-amino-4-deoxy-L-arabinose transferase-like glycosyltransferase|nr:glycosyltransferase family 39 protein [Rubrivivax sp.]